MRPPVSVCDIPQTFLCETSVVSVLRVLLRYRTIPSTGELAVA